jgi:hypothetical protein
MNRIILIGNGFDLAHKMLTNYKNFIDDYWYNVVEEVKNIPINKPFENDDILVQHSPSNFIKKNTYQDLKENLIRNKKSPIQFKNRFLEIITNKTYLNNCDWVDVENEYYILLKESIEKKRLSNNYYKIKDLNSDFNKIKNHLEKYLVGVDDHFNKNIESDFLQTKNIIGHKIYHPFKLKDFSENSINQKAEYEYSLLKKYIDAPSEDKITINELDDRGQSILQKIDLKNPLNGIRKLLQSDYAVNYFDLIPDQTLFLNFNYTFTDKIYKNPREFDQFNELKYTKVKYLHIHGTIAPEDKNPIIFGFGDELDDNYKLIEKLNDNDYLKNIKSINYLDTNNYKQLLEFINSANYQIYIFGHSCGISDRTLLNTVFEHDNCASVKLFYHQKDEQNDNYSDIIRNISRNFNDKAKMRDRVVNKNYSEPLR